MILYHFIGLTGNQKRIHVRQDKSTHGKIKI